MSASYTLGSMLNGRMKSVCPKIFVLCLLVVAVPLLFGLGALSAENWLAGPSVDLDDDDLRAELLPVSHPLMSQGPVVNLVATPLLLLSGIPFHPPV